MKQWFDKNVNEIKSLVNRIAITDPLSKVYTGKPITELLPSDCLLNIVLQLNISDLPKIALVCKKFKDVMSSELLKSALFFQLYGPDYWGEYVGLHPYQSVPPSFNPFQHLRLSDVQPTIEKILKQDSSDIRTALVRIYEIASTQSWSALLDNYKQLSSVWKQNCESSILIAGLPNSGKSTVMDLLEKREGFKLVGHYSSFNKFKITRCEIPAPTSSIPTREAKLCPVNICEVAKPRNWYPHFRNSNEQYQYIIYVVDGVAFNKSDEYKSELYTEFHGMLGEAKESLYTAVGFVISKTDNAECAKQEDILKHLKIVPAAINDWAYNCPYYAGPVTFGVLSLNLLASNAETLIRGLTNFLLLQPSTRPQWSASRTPIVLARLIDSKDGRMNRDVKYKSQY